MSDQADWDRSAASSRPLRCEHPRGIHQEHGLCESSCIFHTRLREFLSDLRFAESPPGLHVCGWLLIISNLIHSRRNPDLNRVSFCRVASATSSDKEENSQFAVILIFL